MPVNAEEEQDLNRIKEAALKLGEHFETVQIFATRHQSETEDNTGTVNCNYGVGNWFARLGFVKDWVIRQDEYTRIGCRKNESSD